MGQTLICSRLRCASPSPSPGTRLAVFCSPAAFLGAQLHHKHKSSFQVVVPRSEPGSFHTSPRMFPHTIIPVTSSSSLHPLSCNTGQISSISLALSPGSFSCASHFHRFLTTMLHLPLMPVYFWQLKRQHMLQRVQSYACAARLASLHMPFTQRSDASCSGGGLRYPFLSSFGALPPYSLLYPVTGIL